MTERRRCSNSPFIEAPACIRPTSSTQSLTPRSGGGTSPDAMRWAKPSTTAVLPTPASPVRIGLFCRRRISTSMIWRISSSRPRIGSISPGFRFGGEILGKAIERRRALGPGCAGRAPGPAATRPEPSIGRRFSSSEPAQILRCSVVELIDRNLGEFLRRRREGAREFARLQARRPGCGRCGSASRRRTAWRNASRGPAESMTVLETAGISVSFLRKP